MSFIQSTAGNSPAFPDSRRMNAGNPPAERAVRVIPFIFFLVSRLLLITLNEAEFTDGYQLLTWSFENPVRWHPLFPLLLKPLSQVIDPVIAGRLLSILSGFGAMIALSKIARTLYGDRAATLASWLYVVSPLFYWTNLRVLTESTFQCLFCWCIYHLLVFVKQEKSQSGPAVVLLSGFGYLTRPEGIILLPVAGYVLWKSAGRQFLTNAMAVLPWCLAFLWGFGVNSSDRYSDILLTTLPDFRWDLAITRLLSYVDVYPYLVFYPFFAFALIHMFHIGWNVAWKWTVLYVHVIFAVMLLVHPAWTTRLLLIPVSLLLVEASAGLLQLARRSQTILLASCMIFSVTAIFLQRQMFSDFKDAAVAVRGSLSNHRVVSDEQAKTEFYLQKRVTVYEKNNLERGDVLILHSYNTDFQKEKQFLNTHYRYTALLSVESRIVPLLANAALSDIDFTNSPLALFQRFQLQRFQSVVLKIDGRKS